MTKPARSTVVIGRVVSTEIPRFSGGSFKPENDGMRHGLAQNIPPNQSVTDPTCFLSLRQILAIPSREELDA